MCYIRWIGEGRSDRRSGCYFLAYEASDNLFSQNQYSILDSVSVIASTLTGRASGLLSDVKPFVRMRGGQRAKIRLTGYNSGVANARMTGNVYLSLMIGYVDKIFKPHGVLKFIKNLLQLRMICHLRTSARVLFRGP